MSQLIQQLDKGAKNILNTLKRFPMVSLSAYLLALILSVFMSVGHAEIELYPNYHIFNKIAFTTTLGIPLFLLLRLLSPKRIFTIVGILLFVIYYFYLPETLEGHNDFESYGQRHLFFIASLTLLIFPAPFLFRSISNENFWEWTKQVLFAFFGAALFGLILYFGLMGIHYAFEKLYHVEFPHFIAKQLAIIVFGIFSINYFLSQIPKEPLLLKAQPYSKMETILTKFILTPLVITYFLILFFYTFRIIYLSEFPTGMMSWLVLLFSGLGILTFLFWTNLWNEKTKKFKKWIWIAILLQTLLLAVSIAIRIEQYGVTENRYFIALMGIWLFLISLYFIVKKNASYKWIFISLALLAFLTQVEPFSAKGISQQSQTAQLKNLLGEESNLSKESPLDLRYQISSKIEYLFKKHGIDSLMPVFPTIVSEYKSWDGNVAGKLKDCNVVPQSYFPSHVTEKLGFTLIDKWQWKHGLKAQKEQMPIYIQIAYKYNGNRVLNIKGYTWMQEFSFDKREGKIFCPPPSILTTNEESSLFSIESQSNHILIKKESQVLATVDISSFLDKLKIKWKKEIQDKQLSNYNRFNNHLFNQEELTKVYENEQLKVKFLFHSLSFSPKKILEDYQGEVLISEK